MIRAPRADAARAGLRGTGVLEDARRGRAFQELAGDDAHALRGSAGDDDLLGVTANAAVGAEVTRNLASQLPAFLQAARRKGPGGGPRATFPLPCAARSSSGTGPGSETPGRKSIRSNL